MNIEKMMHEFSHAVTGGNNYRRMRSVTGSHTDHSAFIEAVEIAVPIRHGVGYPADETVGGIRIDEIIDPAVENSSVAAADDNEKIAIPFDARFIDAFPEHALRFGAEIGDSADIIGKIYDPFSRVHSGKLRHSLYVGASNQPLRATSIHASL
jgi:hypothetical protein